MIRTQAEPMAYRAEADGSAPKLTGHFSVFDQWTEVASMFEGNFMERVVPGAFTKTIAKERDSMKVLFNHGMDTLGKQQLGSIDTLREDEKGAYYEVSLNEGIPPLLMDGLRKGQYGASFRFVVNAMNVVEHPKRSAYNPKQIPERTLTEIGVREFGPVTFPQYKGATAVARSVTDDLIFEWIRAEPELVRTLLNLRPSAARATERREPKRFKNREEYLQWLSKS